MTENEKNEIDAILSAIADEGADRAKIKSLEELLLGRPDLQGYYADRQTMHAVLSLEHSQASRPLLDFRQAIEGPTAAPGGSQVVARSSAGPVYRFALGFLPQICAALVAAAFLGGLMWSLRLRPSPVDRVATASDEVRTWSPTPAASETAPGLVMQDRGSLRLLEKLTRAPLISNVVLPRSSTPAGAAQKLRSGNAWFERLQDSRERGYLVALPAGCLMEVSIDSEATSRNSLAVVEVTPSGATTGQAMVFDNTAAFNTDFSDWQPASKRSVGQIGSFSEFNGSSLPKYYLFTGSYSMADASGEEHWQQSDFRIQFDQEDLMVIGWDDSGYSGLLEQASEFSPDRDFNDMRALLKFSFPGRLEPGRLPKSRFLPKPVESEEVAQGSDQTANGYMLDLLPGEEAVLSITSDARYQNGFLVLDELSGRVLWKHDGVPSGPEHVQPSERGIYVIRNQSDTVQRYRIQGRHKHYLAPESAPWAQSPFQVSDIGAGAVTVGFEDSPSTWQKVDWKDLRVFIKVYSP